MLLLALVFPSKRIFGILKFLLMLWLVFLSKRILIFFAIDEIMSQQLLVFNIAIKPLHLVKVLLRRIVDPKHESFKNVNEGW